VSAMRNSRIGEFDVDMLESNPFESCLPSLVSIPGNG
jgi:hypothetical protein